MRNPLPTLTSTCMIAISILAVPAIARDRVDQGSPTATEMADRADIKIAKMKERLHLSSDQEKNWPDFASALQSLNKKWANLAILVAGERANRQDPVDTLQQINDRADARINLANDWKALATASKPLYASLDKQQKRQFSESLSGQDREPVSN